MNKRALSNLVAYVLLISITLSLSVMVYGWLKFYADTGEIVACPDNVNIVIESYECFPGASGSFKVVLKNKGFFNIDGFMLRVHDRVNAEFGFWVLNDTGIPLGPDETSEKTYLFSDYSEFNSGSGIASVTMVDVQPYILDGSDKVACEAYTAQRVICS